MRKFLTAKWLDLVMANYEVSPSLLDPYLPMGTELDLHEGKCFISLVGFLFRDTRLLGVRVPFHVNFEEINLRFYVRRTVRGELRQGVTFIREIVRRPAVSIIARLAYGEPYETWRTRHSNIDSRVSYKWSRRGIENVLATNIGSGLGVPAAGSAEHFIVEHYWGYTRRSPTRTDEYLVEHPPWEVFAVDDAVIDVDFGATYGDKFAFLTNQRPYSVLFCKGSDVDVYKGQNVSV